MTPRLRIRTPHLALALAILLVCLGPKAPADANPAYLFDGYLVGTADPSGLHLEVELQGNPWSPNQWTVTPAAIDIYRQEIGAVCASWERITDDPILWDWIDEPGGGPHVAFNIDDNSAEAGRGYMYYARAVDASRMSIPENADAYLGVATHGVALIGHGTLYGGPGGCGQSYRQDMLNCVQECFPSLIVGLAPEVAPYLNAGTTVLVYGEITGVTSFCGQNETIAYLSSAVPAGCVVSVEHKTWGATKQIYR